MARRFIDRIDAAKLLVSCLESFRSENPLVLAIPRGGVPIAKYIANSLNCQLDVVLVRKLCAPYYPEVAAGAVSENGEIILNSLGRSISDKEYLNSEIEKQFRLLKARREQYTPLRPTIPLKDRLVILVDDGIATGSTMIAAIQFIRKQHPKYIVCAVPVGSEDSIEKISRICDQVICIINDSHFAAVGYYYQDFRPIEDEEVIALLK